MLAVLSVSESMAAPDVWAATLTLGTGVAVAARLSEQTTRRLATFRRGPSSRRPNGAGGLDSDRERSVSVPQSGVPSSAGELLGGEDISMTEVVADYVALGSEPERA